MRLSADNQFTPKGWQQSQCEVVAEKHRGFSTLTVIYPICESQKMAKEMRVAEM